MVIRGTAKSTCGLKGTKLVEVRNRVIHRFYLHKRFCFSLYFHCLILNAALRFVYVIGSGATTTTTHTTTTVTTSTAAVLLSSTAKCPRCGITFRGQQSCCARGAGWDGKCGNEGENKEHTWNEGWKSCNRKNRKNRLIGLLIECVRKLSFDLLSHYWDTVLSFKLPVHLHQANLALLLQPRQL